MSFAVVVNAPFPAFYQIDNQATIRSLTGSRIVTATTPVGGSTCLVTFTDAFHNPAVVFEENERIYIILDDLDANVEPATAQSVTIQVMNRSTGEQETLALLETGVDTGEFHGSVATSTTVGQGSEDGHAVRAEGDALEVRYSDPDFSPDQCADSATLTTPLAVKTLYLTEPGQSLDRIDPMTTGDSSTASSVDLGVVDPTPVNMAVYGDAAAISHYRAWDGSAFGGEEAGARIMALLFITCRAPRPLPVTKRLLSAPLLISTSADRFGTAAGGQFCLSVPWYIWAAG